LPVIDEADKELLLGCDASAQNSICHFFPVAAFTEDFFPG